MVERANKGIGVEGGGERPQEGKIGLCQWAHSNKETCTEISCATWRTIGATLFVLKRKIT
jgi:hypothetical protein